MTSANQTWSSVKNLRGDKGEKEPVNKSLVIDNAAKTIVVPSQYDLLYHDALSRIHRK